MKNFKLFSVLVVCLAAFAFTSCNTGSDNSYKELTAAEKAYCYQNTYGSRMKKMVYLSDAHKTEDKDYYDTVSVATNIYGYLGADTTLTVSNIPMKIFARYIPETSDTKDMKTALENYEGTASLVSNVYYYSTSPVTFLLNPTTTLSCNLEYGGETHKISIYVLGNSYYSYGNVDANTKKLSAYLLAYGYKIDADDKDTTYPTSFSFLMGSQNSTSSQLRFIEE